MARSWGIGLVLAGIPVALFIWLALSFVRTVSPCQEEIFDRVYRQNVICSTTDPQGHVADIYCLEAPGHRSLERVRRWGPLTLRSTWIRPELVFQIGSYDLPLLEQSYQGAAYALLIRLGLAIFGHNVYGLRLPLVMLGALIIVLTYLLFSRTFDRGAGFLVALLMATATNSVLAHSVVVYVEAFYAITLLGIAFLMQRGASRGFARRAVLAGFLAGWAIYCNLLSIAGLLAFGAAALIGNRRQLRRLLLPWWASLLAFMTPVTPYFLLNLLMENRTSSLLGRQILSLVTHPLNYVQLLVERFEHLHLALQGFGNAVIAVGGITAAKPLATYGYEYLFYGSLVILLLGWGAGDADRANTGRLWALTAIFIPFFSAAPLGTVLNMIVLTEPLIPIVLGLGARNLGRVLANLAPQPQRPRVAGVLAVALPVLAVIIQLHLTWGTIRVLPLIREGLIPRSATQALARYLEENQIADAVDVHIEDLRYPVEFLTNGRVRMKHHFTFPGPGGFNRVAADSEWDRVLALNRGRHFALKANAFLDAPADVDLFLAACRRNGVSARLVTRILNQAGETVIALYQID